ncbi:MAG: DUF1015 family protein [Anaerovoracaceae bacterium]
MAIVRPFMAVRPSRAYVEKVIALPYDVMNTEEARDMAKGNPYSFLNVSRAEINLEKGANPYAREVYEKSKETISQFLEKGIFVKESKPMIYVYRQTMGEYVQTGIVACVSIDEYKNNIIKKHELTRVDKEKDRINHFDICNANTEPVFLTYRDNKKIRSLIESYISNHGKEYDITTDDNVRHEFWAVSNDNVISGICGLFMTIPAFYIADGHHRTASAYKVGMKRREENPEYTGREEFNYFMAAIFPDEDLKIFDYNRVIKDLNGNTIDEFINKVEEAGFEVTKKGTEPFRPERKTQFGMFLDKNWYCVELKPGNKPEGLIEGLDVAILQDKILNPILGIEDPRTDKRIDFIGGIRGLAELEKRATTDMKVAFAVHPVDINDILEVSDNGLTMPPKSTWFEPKLASGLFLHEL